MWDSTAHKLRPCNTLVGHIQPTLNLTIVHGGLLRGITLLYNTDLLQAGPTLVETTHVFKELWELSILFSDTPQSLYRFQMKHQVSACALHTFQEAPSNYCYEYFYSRAHVWEWWCQFDGLSSLYSYSSHSLLDSRIVTRFHHVNHLPPSVALSRLVECGDDR